VDFLFSLASGGITGILGSLVTGVMGYFKQKELNAHSIALKELDLKAISMQIESKKEIAEIQKDGLVTTAELGVMKQSMQSQDMVSTEKTRNNLFYAPFFIFIDLVRSSIRPALTIYLIILTTFIYHDLQLVIDNSKLPFTQEEASGLITYIIQSLIYLTTTVVLWWFGTRLKENLINTSNKK